jgi:CheY-like chemotaxis protein
MGYSRVDERPTTLSDVGEVLSSVLRMVGAAVRLRANVVVEVGALPPVHGASSRLAQLFTNLVVNALQALPPRPLDENRLVVRARCDASEAGPVVVVEIADNGVGVAPEVRPRLFEPFFTTKPGEGTGLGLYVCRKIVDGLGGRIEVESALGVGTTFRVTLPAAPEAGSDPNRTVRDETATGALAPGRRMRILLVDDEPNLLRVVSRVLEEHEVVAVESGREAAARFDAGERFDLVLCDLMLRDLSGVELFHRIVALEPSARTRVLFLSGGAFTEEAAAFLELLPAAQLLEKPFTPPALLAAVARLMSQRAP